MLCVHVLTVFYMHTLLHIVSSKAKVPIPTPINLVKYIDDAAFGHEDFTLSAANITLRARV